VIAYFDTSAIVPLLIEEPGSDTAESLWQRSERVVTVRISYPEARAALAHARRIGRIDSSQLRRATVELDARFDRSDIVEIDAGLARRAGDLAEEQSLRGYDAVHLAAAHAVGDGDVVMVAADAALLAAAASTGLMTAVVG
jgi:predicted nucleic acid-binding protein